MTNYGDKDYWDRRYEREENDPFDWLFSYDDVQDIIQFLIPKKERSLLMIGCGNAPFSNDM